MAWPDSTGVIGMATGSVLMALERLGTWEGNRAWPHDTREVWMASGSGHMAPG